MKTKRWSYPRYKIPCACGCGTPIDNRDKRGTQRFYVNGHQCKGRKLIPDERSCFKCGSRETYAGYHQRGYWNYKWRKYDGHWYCSKCSNRYFENPRLHPIYGPKRINFKGKRIQLKQTPRTGQCADCNRRVGEEYVNWKGETKILKRTALHHIEYHPDDPLKDTVELCLRCHLNRHNYLH